MQKFTFQVNLGGIIDILANHLYSNESVFIRELLQNATDAITQRQKKDKKFQPSIEIALSNFPDAPSQLSITDNGIGLREEEVHAFLSTIGASSKKDELLKKRTEFIGQFGIGLLSCFVAAEEIVVITKAVGEAKPVKWVGKSDGTYEVTVLDIDFEPGTRVYLTAKKEAEKFYEYEKLKELAIRYANFLPFPIQLLKENGATEQVNEGVFPWEQTFESETEKKNALIEFAGDYFEERFIDCIPVKSAASATEGYAFISLRTYSFNQEQQHALYLHRMFLSDKAVNVLPEWLFFAKCIVSSKGLRPTASRETIYEDALLEKTRKQLGDCILQYFYDLKIKDPKLLATIISHHHTAIKLAAISNNEFFKQIHRFVIFQTNFGMQTLGDLLDKNQPIRFISDVDEFSKIAGIASNQSIEVVNAGFVYETSFFERLAELYPALEVQAFDAGELILEMEDIELDEREESFEFVRLANVLLQKFDCVAEIKKFHPDTMPALYFRNSDMEQLRNLRKSKEVADDLWGGILNNIAKDAFEDANARLCFNYNNPLIKKAILLNQKERASILIEMLYVQSLLLGRHPLQTKELSILNNGLGYLIENLTQQNG